MNYFVSRRASLPRSALNLVFLIFCAYWIVVVIIVLLSASPMGFKVPDAIIAYGAVTFFALLGLSILWAIVLGVAAVYLNSRSFAAWTSLLLGGFEAAGFIALLISLSRMHL